MYQKFCFALFVIVPLASFSQEEKGCGNSGRFSVNYGLTESGGVNNYFYCTGWYSLHCPGDTVFIEIDSEEDVIMSWTYKDELQTGYSSIIDNPVEWYRNDSLLDPSELIVYEDITSGACGPKYLAGASIETHVLGSYQLRKTHFPADLPVIVLREKAAELPIHEEITLTVYPNPSSDVVSIKHGQVKNVDLTLHSIDGKIVAHPLLDSSEGITQVDVSQLPRGSYILTFSSDQHPITRTKIQVI